MTKTYAQIETSLPHSQKIRRLSHKERWAYLCAHLSPLGCYIGTFRYPLAVWADDAALTRSDLEEAIAAMEQVGLVSYEADESFVQIVGWFLKKNAPENASRMASRAADYADLDAPQELVVASAAEFAVGSIKRAQRWKPDSVEWSKLRDVFKPFLTTMRQTFEDDFHQALSEQFSGQNRAINDELCALMPSLQYYLEAPCLHRGGTRDDTTRRRHEHKITRRRNLHGAFSQRKRANVGPAYNSAIGIC
ncbi:MAG: hypothetical protein ABF254_07720 [Octadecabacter sp.]